LDDDRQAPASENDRVSSTGNPKLSADRSCRIVAAVMKIRIGVGAAGASATPAALAELVNGIDDLGFDSIWLSEVLTGPVLDPVVGLAWAAASNPRVKLGTTMLLPGRNVVRLAKQLASLDVLCDGRLLVTLVPGLTYPPERDAIGVDPKRRGAVIDEALPLLRRLWAGETVSHEGVAGTFRDVKLSPRPVQQPLEVWLGGTVPAALERCGRLSDGWLPSLCTPEEAAAGRVVIEEAAARAGRSISPEHFGMSIGYAREAIDPATARTMVARRPRSVELTPVGLPALRALIERFLAVGFSKFVVRPIAPPTSWRAELEALSKAVGDLQT
jgi:probable F420-dependent oxidoreductase